jgi:hypothetical protein
LQVNTREAGKAEDMKKQEGKKKGGTEVPPYCFQLELINCRRWFQISAAVR